MSVWLFAAVALLFLGSLAYAAMLAAAGWGRAERQVLGVTRIFWGAAGALALAVAAAGALRLIGGDLPAVAVISASVDVGVGALVAAVAVCLLGVNACGHQSGRIRSSVSPASEGTTS